MIPSSGNLPYTQSNERSGAPMNTSPYLSAPNANVFSGLQNRAQQMLQGSGGGARASLTLEDQINLVAEECGAYPEGTPQKDNCLQRLRSLTEQSQQAAEAKDAAAKAAQSQKTPVPTPGSTLGGLGVPMTPGAAPAGLGSQQSSASMDELDRLVQQRATAQTPREREVINRRIEEILRQRSGKTAAENEQARRDALEARRKSAADKATADDKARFARWLQKKRGTSFTDPKELDTAFGDADLRNQYEAWKKESYLESLRGPRSNAPMPFSERASNEAPMPFSERASSETPSETPPGLAGPPEMTPITPGMSQTPFGPMIGKFSPVPSISARTMPSSPTRPLAPRQERMVPELLQALLNGEITLEQYRQFTGN